MIPPDTHSCVHVTQRTDQHASAFLDTRKSAETHHNCWPSSGKWRQHHILTGFNGPFVAVKCLDGRAHASWEDVLVPICR